MGCKKQLIVQFDLVFESVEDGLQHNLSACKSISIMRWKKFTKIFFQGN